METWIARGTSLDSYLAGRRAHGPKFSDDPTSIRLPAPPKDGPASPQAAKPP